ncbi:protein of unknown function [Candidatus Hydrogenisulfobacillus filiaventi]|uniref:DUF6504 domain-containing protein n=1 Tax=Candidatus Hydrogenisulfobacillus filiaventi TaxID=2707344 RepID=A0A6F8ZFB7_9FIRM|nr:hypothetical protein [Bacillota bacterium]CAB1128289.1 protein of unknown function [Candidatus Hydrogenisulfobacillus filiaventi]
MKGTDGDIPAPEEAVAPIPPPDREGGTLRGFRYRRHYRPVVEVLEVWTDVGAWWAGEPERRFWRVRTADHGLYELADDGSGRHWWLYRIYD